MSGLRLPCSSAIAALRWRSYSPGGLGPVPVEEHVDALAQLARDLARIAEQEVERRPRHRALAGDRLEARLLAAPAVRHQALERVAERRVGRVAAERVAARLAREQVVQVAAHRLALAEPRLRHDVLAVERQLALELVERVLELSRAERRLAAGELVQVLRAAQRDLGVRADERLGLERLAGVDAAQAPVRVQVDPRVDALGRLVGGVRVVRPVEQVGERVGQLRRRRVCGDRLVVGVARRRVGRLVVVRAFASGRELGERPPDLGFDSAGRCDIGHAPTLSPRMAAVNHSSAARSSSSARSRSLRVSSAACSNSARASSTPAELGEQVAAHAREQVVALQRRLVAQRVDDLEPGRRAERHRHRDARLSSTTGDGASCASAS